MTALRTRLTRTRLLGRDAVITVSLAVSGLIALLPVFGWPANTVGAVTAALVAAGGVTSAWLVSVDRALPLLVGLGKAVIAAVISFGVHLPDNWVTAIMSVLTLIAGLATRPQVGAVQPARGRDVDGDEFVRLDPHSTYTVSTELPADIDPNAPVPPLPPAAPRLRQDPGPMPWSAGDAGGPATEYLPRVGEHEVQQRGPREQPGRHRVQRPHDPWSIGGPEFGG